MAVSYDYYRVFYYVGTCGSFTRAAALLMNSQPNITRTINLLEEELGCRLFLRSRKGVTFTPEGERLFAHVRAAFEQLAAGEREIGEAASLRSGSVLIGASEVALHGFLLPVLRSFRRAHPGIRVRITNHSTPQAVAAVRDGTLELAVVTTPTEVREPLREEILARYRDILIAGPGYEAGKGPGQTRSIRGIAEEQLICLGRETGTFALYDRFFARHGVVLAPDIETATTDQILPLVKYDLGIGFIPRWFAADALRSGEVQEIPLREELPERGISLIWDHTRPLGAAASEVRRMLHEEKKRFS